MARRKVEEIMECPFCKETVQYWPNCSKSTCRDFGNIAYSQTKRGTKIFFHISCFKKYVEEQNNENRKR